MSIERTNRLRIALQKAKAGLPELDEQRPENPSKLGRLLNKPATNAKGRGFIQSQSIHERPLLAAISKEVLGDDVTYQPAIKLDESHPVSRLKSLRERNFDQVIPEGSLGDKIGFSSSGQPLWSSILDEQRSMPINALPQELTSPEQSSRTHHRTVLSSNTNWPNRLDSSHRKTFKNWKVIPENKQSSIVCESIIDHLGQRHNPHIIVGEREVGKSHLLHATGQSVLRYYDGDVRILRATELLSLDSIPNDWHESMATTALLLIDDAHLVAEHEQHAQSIGHLVDHALNLGVHVLCTSLSHPREWTSSRLWELLRNASSSTMHHVTEGSLALHIKNQGSLLGMLFEDAHIMEILNHVGQSWRGVEAALSTLNDAKERGQEILDPEDVRATLTGESVQTSTMKEPAATSSITLASDILKRATDVVYTGVDSGGIELHAPPIEEQEDDWEPSLVSPEDLTTANDLLEMHLKTTLEQLTPEAPTVLDVDSRDHHLAHQLGTVKGDDIGRTADLLVGIDTSVDGNLAVREEVMVNVELWLTELELMMEDLLLRTAFADENEPMDIDDELRKIEHQLGLIKENVNEAFELEDEAIKVAHLSTIKPTTRLLGEEE